MPTNKRNRVAATKKRRHASPVTSSQNSCTGEANLQEVCGRHASPVTSSQKYHSGEANLQKLAVRPVKMASSSHRRGNYQPSSSSDDIALLACMSLLLDTSSSEEEEREILRQPQRTFPISGQEYTTLLLNGDPDTMGYTLRVDAHTFRTLVNLLVKRGRLKWDCMRLSVEESLAIFLYICGHGKRHRCAANWFKRSMNTIARHFKYMMRALGMKILPNCSCGAGPMLIKTS
ncbi:hypothetical protein RHMOL_Rhmol02G0147400 [Rhododendron molle]|uniref:Uncharacterized protein n=1 Tax=Rhododendron molle TaxID=49168 RepID=A0ACC0PPZ7_RHOML|nr:hypothetical protein RHMOL_Rhmol02G0147400 [Rhododendron molle]